MRGVLHVFDAGVPAHCFGGIGSRVNCVKMHVAFVAWAGDGMARYSGIVKLCQVLAPNVGSLQSK
jgi:hypothetical protein